MESTFLAKEQVSSALDKESKNLLLHHLHCFLDNDLESLMNDYTEHSVMITRDKTYYGKVQIKGFFSELMKHFPAKSSDFKLEKLEVSDEVAFIVWQATTPTVQVSFGTDTFLIKKSKIYRQTFAGEMKFLN
jgi:ketosteroid isomerase-like protein